MSEGAASVHAVPTPADPFIAYVDRLAADREAGSSDARVARAMAGESPARFRARILLERAAHLMVATDRTLRDIALDGGFPSQEVFTRAFRREFGVLPSVWRAEPTGWRIDAPGDVHFHPPSGIRLPARHRTDGVDLVVEMVEHHVWFVGELVDRAHQVSDHDLDLPTERSVTGTDGATLRSTLARLVGQMERFHAVVHDGDQDAATPERDSVSSLRHRLDRVGPELVDDVSMLAATGRFDETFVDAFSPTPGVLSYGAMVAHLLTFAAHDRLLALVRLRDCGVGDLAFGDPQHWFATGRRSPG